MIRRRHPYCCASDIHPSGVLWKVFSSIFCRVYIHSLLNITLLSCDLCCCSIFDACVVHVSDITLLAPVLLASHCLFSILLPFDFMRSSPALPLLASSSSLLQAFCFSFLASILELDCSHSTSGASGLSCLYYAAIDPTVAH